MASFWASSALATAMMASTAMGFAIGAIPVETVGGFGDAFSPRPTEAPLMELVKAKLVRKALTNTCTEWTVPGGFGQPQCDNSETCLFKTASNGYLYEGCGQTSIAYDWVTECFNYPQSGTPPLSEIYCPKSAPYCGFFGFVFGTGVTAYNFGCSTSSYGVLVQRASTSSGSSSSSTFQSASTKALTSDFTTSSTTARSTSTSSVRLSGASSSASSTATIGSHRKAKVVIGLIVGVIVGALAIIALLIALLVWFCVRKRRQRKAVITVQTQQQQADAASATAFQNNQRVSEIGGSNVKPFVGAYAPNGQEKLGAVVGATKTYGSAQPIQQNNGGNAYPPPPMYAQPGPSPMQSPNQNCNELATPQSEPGRSVSPVVGSTPSQTPHPQMYGQYSQQPNQPGELVGDNRQPSPVPHQMYQQYPPPPRQGQQYQTPPTELAGENRHSSPPPPTQQQQQSYVSYPPPLQAQPQPTELGGENLGSRQTPPRVQEIGSGAIAETRQPKPPQGPPPPGVIGQQHEPIAEMSATAASKVSRRPVGSSPNQAVDMSGAPMNEHWNGHHELE